MGRTRSTYFGLLPILVLVILGDVSLATSCRILPPYNGVALVRVTFSGADQAQSLRAAVQRICELKLMDPERGFSNSVNDLLLTSAQLQFLRAELGESAVTVLDADIGASIRRETAAIAAPLGVAAFQATENNSEALNESFYNKFHVYADLENRWKLLNRTYSLLRLEVIGRSVEGRPIYAMRIGRTSRDAPVRVLFNGLQHAREWITTMAALYAAEKFAAASANRASPLFRYLSEVEVIVLPMVNPDGFVHTQAKDRLWRKNRQRVTCPGDRPLHRNGTAVDTSAGVDLNRNWGKDFGGGKSTSRNPCFQTFIGARAFSAPETAAVRDFVRRTPGIRAHIDIHSYTQLVIGPWGFTAATPPRAGEIDRLGAAIARNLSSGGKVYRYGRGANNRLYLASGTMMDWFFARNITSFTFELRPDRSNFNGFLLDPKQILPTCRETLTALSTMVRYTSDPNLKLVQDSPGGLSRAATYAIIGAAAGVVVIAVAAIIIMCCCLRKRRRDSE